MNPDYSEARFILAVLIVLTAIVALFTKFLTGGEFVAIATATLTLYTAHSAIDDKIRDWKGVNAPERGHE